MINNMFTTRRSRLPQKGFTIIETLMAVLVLSIAIAGSLALASKGLSAIQAARQEVNAVYLAQNAMEYIRQLRDTNCLAASGSVATCPTGAWLGTAPNNIASKCGDSGGCEVDTLSGTVTVCPSAGCDVLNYDAVNTLYTYSGVGTTPTAFTRTIYVQSPVGGNANEASTTVLVRWLGQGGVVRSMRIHDDLYNWQ